MPERIGPRGRQLAVEGDGLPDGGKRLLPTADYTVDLSLPVASVLCGLLALLINIRDLLAASLTPRD